MIKNIIFLENTIENIKFVKDNSDYFGAICFMVESYDDIDTKDYLDLENVYFLKMNVYEVVKKNILTVINISGFSPEYIVVKGGIVDISPFSLMKFEKEINIPIYSIIDMIKVPLNDNDLFVLDHFDLNFIINSNNESRLYFKGFSDCCIENKDCEDLMKKIRIFPLDKKVMIEILKNRSFENIFDVIKEDICLNLANYKKICVSYNFDQGELSNVLY